jgi:hypothetical protein
MCPSIGPAERGPDGSAKRRSASGRGRRSRGYRPRGPLLQHADGSFLTDLGGYVAGLAAFRRADSRDANAVRQDRFDVRESRDPPSKARSRRPARLPAHPGQRPRRGAGRLPRYPLGAPQYHYSSRPTRSRLLADASSCMRYHRGMEQPDALVAQCRNLARMEDSPAKHELMTIALEMLQEYEDEGSITKDLRLVLERIVMGRPPAGTQSDDH